MLNNKNKYLYTTYVLVCQNSALIFSRTRKQNWIIICQCCLGIWRGGGGGGEEEGVCGGGEGRGFKMFCQRGQNSVIFLYHECSL